MSQNDKVYLAVDLGASGGRVLAALYDGSHLRLEEVHRFGNGGILAHDRLYWDVLGLWEQVLQGLSAAAAKYGDRVASIGVDTWGVDFALLGPGDELLGNPVHYRDARTQGMMEQAFETVPRDEIFDETGLQFMELNTLYQLLALQQQNPQLLAAARSFLMMPDLFHWLLTGEQANEYTNATTTQFFNPRTSDWSRRLLERFGLPTELLRDIVRPGTELGRLRQSVAASTGLGSCRVVLPGTHDTASAVMAVPVSSAPSEKPNWCYISSGTWSLMGVETPSPIINQTCREFNFTNEGGVGHTTRVLKNIAGLWLVQECRRIWHQEGSELSWSDMVTRAEGAAPLVSLIDPDAGQFVAPANMPVAIREFCQRTGQPVPETRGAIVRAALESLALRCRVVLDCTRQLTGSPIDTIHIVGGGTQNKLLCQLTADACGCRVLAGPIEATAIGNVMMQSVSQGDTSSISQAREVIFDSFEVAEFHAHATSRWDEALDRFQKLCTDTGART